MRYKFDMLKYLSGDYKIITRSGIEAKVTRIDFYEPYMQVRLDDDCHSEISYNNLFGKYLDGPHKSTLDLYMKTSKS